jgi:histidinol-phosphate/aromatic aminotransferase/cobyric acid decarboxylase-like protein
VIFAWPCPGCWLARNEEEVQQRIDEFRRVWLINREGIAAAERILTPDPGLRLAEALRAATRQAQWTRRLRAGLTLAGLLAWFVSRWGNFLKKESV